MAEKSRGMHFVFAYVKKKQYLRQYSTTVHRTLDRAELFTRHEWGPLRKYVYLCRSDAPRCSFRSNCQVKAVLHLQTIRKNERDF